MQSLKEVFETINHLKENNLVKDYALGGALAALFYTEVARTFDVDIFVIIEAQGPIVTLTEIYNWYKNYGFEAKGKHIIVHGVPLQILVGNSGLEKEAIENAQTCDYENTKIKVMTPEYLVALYLKAGGSKRRERALALLEIETINKNKVLNIWSKYNLSQTLLPEELKF